LIKKQKIDPRCISPKFQKAEFGGEGVLVNSKLWNLRERILCSLPSIFFPHCHGIIFAKATLIKTGN